MPGKARKSKETKKFGECITLIHYNVIHMYKINVYAITYILECFCDTDNDRVDLNTEFSTGIHTRDMKVMKWTGGCMEAWNTV